MGQTRSLVGSSVKQTVSRCEQRKIVGMTWRSLSRGRGVRTRMRRATFGCGCARGHKIGIYL